MPVFSSSGLTFHYHDEGIGKPVFLVHGFASNFKTNWENTGWIKAFLSRKRRVIAMDLRGHGKSTKFPSPSDYHPGLMGRDILALMDHLQIEQADLLGYSMGAWISAHLMISSPARFNAVVLGGMGDNLLLFGNRSERIAEALTTPFPESITEPFLKGLRQFSELIGNDARALAACTRGVYSPGMPELERAEKPVLLITGDSDQVAGHPDQLARLIPGAQTIIVPGCDHLTALTRREFKEEVMRFLDRHSAG